MRHALLVSGAVAWPSQLATTWRRSGDEVTVVLVDGAVPAARVSSADAATVVTTIDSGVTVIVEDAALRRRGIGVPDLLDGVKVTDLDEIAALIADGADRVVWL